MDIKKVLDGIALISALCFVYMLGKADIIDLLPLLSGISLPMVYQYTQEIKNEKKTAPKCKDGQRK